jgi:hypothetical protein
MALKYLFNNSKTTRVSPRISGRILSLGPHEYEPLDNSQIQEAKNQMRILKVLSIVDQKFIVDDIETLKKQAEAGQPTPALMNVAKDQAPVQQPNTVVTHVDKVAESLKIEQDPSGDLVSVVTVPVLDTQGNVISSMRIQYNKDKNALFIQPSDKTLVIGHSGASESKPEELPPPPEVINLNEEVADAPDAKSTNDKSGEGDGNTPKVVKPKAKTKTASKPKAKTKPAAKPKKSTKSANLEAIQAFEDAEPDISALPPALQAVAKASGSPK